MEVIGVAPHAKQFVARAVRALGKVAGKKKKQFTYPVTFRVDPDAELGFTDIEELFDGSYVAPHEEAAATN